MTIFLVRPTPEALYRAAEIYSENKYHSIDIQEVGRRSIINKLTSIRHDSGKDVVIITPFVCNTKIVNHLKKITSAGGEVHWHGESDQQGKGNLISRCKSINKLHFYDQDFEFKPDPEDEKIKNFLRFKITKAFLGDLESNFDHGQLKEAVEWLSKNPNTIPEGEKQIVNIFARLSFPAIEGNSIKMKQLKKDLRKLAKSDINVLLLGETGTGKEAAAFFIHCLDPNRNKKEYDAINCSVLQENFLISELFGHEKGAYTDAIRERRGLIPKLDGGTLFLDELPDMPGRVQSMLLRFLESGVYTPMGSDKIRRADVKIVAGGQLERLSEKIKSMEFRKDLYYRLAGKNISIPNLRDIPEDIPLLIDHLVYKMGGSNQDRNETIEYFAKRMKELKSYYWPGNVRELANYVKRRLKLGEDEHIILGDGEIDYLEYNKQIKATKNLAEFNAITNFEGIVSDKSIESANDVNIRYIKHVYGQLSNEGVPACKIADILKISKNTLRAKLAAARC